MLCTMTRPVPNPAHELDAAMTFLFHIYAHWRRASDVER